jgi:MOSC domain-containing protein YiiM
MGVLVSVNVGRARETAHSEVGVTGIDKRPVTGPVSVRAPGPRSEGGGSGLVGDTVCDLRFHGGDDQAVYAYAREDLEWWSDRLDRPLSNGSFGENLTTSGVAVTDAVIGERWRIGTAVLQVCSMRIPCRTFAGWLDEQGWIRTFTEQARPGAYLRVLVPGAIRVGDEVVVVDRPAHGVTAGVAFRALTRQPALLPELLRADDLAEQERDIARNRLARVASS